MIYQNGILVKLTGEIYLSTHVWDYQEIDIGNGYHYMIDGGLDYFRYGYSDEIKDNLDYYVESLNLTSESPKEEIYRKLCWGTYGKDGKGPLKRKLIRTLEKDHLEAILANVPNISPIHKETIEYWLKVKTDKRYINPCGILEPWLDGKTLKPVI